MLLDDTRCPCAHTCDPIKSMYTGPIQIWFRARSCFGLNSATPARNWVACLRFTYFPLWAKGPACALALQHSGMEWRGQFCLLVFRSSQSVTVNNYIYNTLTQFMTSQHSWGNRLWPVWGVGGIIRRKYVPCSTVGSTCNQLASTPELFLDPNQCPK